MCVSVGITHAQTCKVSPEVKEEEGEYPCILDMGHVTTQVVLSGFLSSGPGEPDKDNLFEL